MEFICAHCNSRADKSASHVNRARKDGYNLYCSYECSYLGRRVNKSIEQRKAEKAAYDKEYRLKNRDAIKKKKAAYFKKNYDPVKAAKHRKTRMPYHINYCRKPEYKAWKKEYDRKYRAKKEYGEFAECFLLTLEIREECLKKSTAYQIRLERGDFLKRKERKHGKKTDSNKLKAGPMGNLERGERGQNGRLSSR